MVPNHCLGHFFLLQHLLLSRCGRVWVKDDLSKRQLPQLNYMHVNFTHFYSGAGAGVTYIKVWKHREDFFGINSRSTEMISDLHKIQCKKVTNCTSYSYRCHVCFMTDNWERQIAVIQLKSSILYLWSCYYSYTESMFSTLSFRYGFSKGFRRGGGGGGGC